MALRKETRHATLLRSLGQKQALGLVIGTVIGTGVFLKAAVMSQEAGSPLAVLAAWVLAGLLSLAGAFCYAELGALMPEAGGEYVYLRDAYGELAAFLYGWMRFWIGSPGSIAAYGVGAATFAAAILPLPGAVARTALAMGFIVVFSIVNCVSVLLGGSLQAFLTFLKIVLILGVSWAIFQYGNGGSWSHLRAPAGPPSWHGWSAFGSAMIAALWAYDGWNNMPMAAGEIREPERVIPRALALGMLTVLGLYALANVAFFYALPFPEVLASYSPATPGALPVATRAAQAAFGSLSVSLLSGAFVLSALGAMNGSILTGARIPYAMARDGYFFESLGRVGGKGRVPIASVIAQMLVSCALAASGTFDQLTDYVIFASFIFYAAVTTSLFVQRRRHPGRPLPFSAPFYPWLPALFILVSALLLLNTIVNSPLQTAIGAGFILSGIPAYLWFRSKGLR